MWIVVRFCGRLGVPSGYGRCIAGDGSGLEVSPYRLLED
jgi:hypothetical protein